MLYDLHTVSLQMWDVGWYRRNPPEGTDWYRRTLARSAHQAHPTGGPDSSKIFRRATWLLVRERTSSEAFLVYDCMSQEPNAGGDG